MKLTLKRLDELILDEEAASKEYGKLSSVDPYFTRLSSDESRHHKFLLQLKEKLSKK
jgi:hypothetical protein